MVNPNWNASARVPPRRTLQEVNPKHFSLHTSMPVGNLFKAQEMKLVKSGTTPRACPKLFETNVPNMGQKKQCKILLLFLGCQSNTRLGPQRGRPQFEPIVCTCVVQWDRADPHATRFMAWSPSTSGVVQRQTVK